jgi:hypothetical protein
MRLPGEDELRDAVREKLAAEFRVASDLLAIGTGIFQPTVRPAPKDEIENIELWMCLGIVSKACRQYRAIVALAEIALGDVADSNCRMLAETMLAAQFLMRPALVLKQGNKPLPEVPGFPLTRAFRAKLYIAHDATSTLKTLREMAKYGGINAEDAGRALAVAERHAKEESDGIGEEWARRQRERKTYSGLSVLELAESLDLPFLYDSFYRPSSASVHGTDARRYVEAQEQPDGGISFSAIFSEKGVAEALVFSSLMLLEVLKVANERFGLGLDESLYRITPRIQGMARRLPGE